MIVLIQVSLAVMIHDRAVLGKVSALVGLKTNLTLV